MPGRPLSEGDTLREIDYSEPYKEFLYEEPEVPNKSQNVWVVEETTDKLEAPLRQALEKARVDLGYDRRVDIFWASGSDAIAHAKVVLALYASFAGGNRTSVSEDLIDQLGGAEATLEWRTVGEPTFRDVRYLPAFVYMTQNFEVRISGFQKESVVVEGNTYTRKAPIQTDWFAVVPHRFSVSVDSTRISLGD